MLVHQALRFEVDQNKVTKNGFFSHYGASRFSDN
jgi:hypothetical protein